MSVNTTENVKEFNDLLNQSSYLTYKKRLELYHNIKLVNSLEIDQEKTSKLADSIVSTSKNIENLNLLKNLGFELNETISGLKLTRSKKGIIIDRITIAISVVSTFALSMMLYKSIVSNNISTLSIVMMILIFIAGVYFFSLLIKGIDRIIRYHKFELTKSKNNITLNKKDDLTITKLSFSTESKFAIENSPEKTGFYIEENAIKTEILTFKNINIQHLNTLEALCMKLNDFV